METYDIQKGPQLFVIAVAGIIVANLAFYAYILLVSKSRGDSKGDGSDRRNIEARKLSDGTYLGL